MSEEFEERAKKQPNQAWGLTGCVDGYKSEYRPPWGSAEERLRENKMEIRKFRRDLKQDNYEVAREFLRDVQKGDVTERDVRSAILELLRKKR